MLVVGTIVGAGLASGQEIVVFFAQYGFVSLFFNVAIFFIFFFGIRNFLRFEKCTYENDFKKKKISNIFDIISIVIFAICLFLSTFTHKTRKTIGISLGIVFASYFLNVISEMGESTEFLKYISIFTLADIRNVIVNVSINPLMVILAIGITAIFMILTIIRYDKKELI